MLRNVRSEYADIVKQVRQGSARNCFKGNPEQIVKKMVSGSLTETQADAILTQVHNYDFDRIFSDEPSALDYLRRSTLYNQMVKHGVRSEGGLIVRLNPESMIKDLDTNPVYKKIYGNVQRHQAITR